MSSRRCGGVGGLPCSKARARAPLVIAGGSSPGGPARPRRPGPPGGAGGRRPVAGHPHVVQVLPIGHRATGASPSGPRRALIQAAALGQGQPPPAGAGPSRASSAHAALRSGLSEGGVSPRWGWRWSTDRTGRRASLAANAGGPRDRGRNDGGGRGPRPPGAGQGEPACIGPPLSPRSAYNG
jgi:hypothetical protein